MSVFLSIDFDFFPYMGVWDRHEITTPDGRTAEVAGVHLYDWGHSEGGGALFSDLLWHFRAEGFAAGGLSLEGEFNIRPEKGSVPVDEFVSRLAERFELPEVVAASDSHAAAYRIAAEASAWDDLHVVHFDAHHDLGYGQSRVERAIRAQQATCEDWLYHLLRTGYAQRATIVYPDWQGLKEWEDGQPWLEGFDIEVTTWSDWLHATEDERTTAVATFSCLSSAWTPPYLDPEWLRLLDLLALSVDWLDGEPYQPREWNTEGIEEGGARIRDLMAEANTRNAGMTE